MPMYLALKPKWTASRSKPIRNVHFPSCVSAFYEEVSWGVVMGIQAPTPHDALRLARESGVSMPAIVVAPPGNTPRMVS